MGIARHVSTHQFTYVSCIGASMSNATPATIKAAHWVHRHPLYTAQNPPITGPRAEPRKPDIMSADMQSARVRSGYKSAVVPPVIATHGPPMDPARNLHTSSPPNVGVSADPRTKRKYAAPVTLYTVLRPNTSDIGAAMAGPEPKPRVKRLCTK